MSHALPRYVKVLDSHTGGEPTRVILAGGPDLGSGPVAQQAQRLRDQEQAFRAAVVNEPRGSDVLVAALVCEPADPSCVAGVIFFNNVDCLGMCGHGTIGFVTSLAHLGRIAPGEHRLETPVGIVSVTLHEDGSVSLVNVPSFRLARQIPIDVAGHGTLHADIAYGGNWFCLIEQPLPVMELAHTPELLRYAKAIRAAVNAQGYPQVDHVELYGPPKSHEAHARNFVLCPGGAYDRSPCGTGTSAKLACLAAEGLLAEGESWIQESIVGSRFVGSFRWLDQATGKIAPRITGRAHLTAEATLILDSQDPFCFGIHSR